MKKYSVKIGIFRLGFSFGTKLAQHKIECWIVMEGWKFREWKKRIRKREWNKSDIEDILIELEALRKWKG